MGVGMIKYNQNMVKRYGEIVNTDSFIVYIKTENLKPKKEKRK